MIKQQQISIVAKKVNLNLVDILVDQFKIPISIITPNINLNKINNIEIFDDNEFLNKKSFFNRCKHKRANWLYQQFLKYQIVIKSDYENTLIIDGDSLIKDEKFLKKNILYYTPKKIEEAYSYFILKNLGQDFVTQRNYITNQMNFNKETLISMLDTALGSTEKYPDFIMNFLLKNPDSEFSEYQCYAAWSLNTMKPSSQIIKVFRRHDLINANPIDSLQKYDLIAFEHEHKSSFLRALRAQVLYVLGKNLG